MSPVVDFHSFTPAMIAFAVALAAAMAGVLWRWGDRAMPFVFGAIACGAAFANACGGAPVVGVLCGMLSGACIHAGVQRVRSSRLAVQRAALRKS